MLDYLSIPIFQRARVAGALLAALLAVLGVLVTARGLAYLGDGLSHAAFGGIALGMFLGLTSPLTVAIPFTARSAIGIGALRRRGASAPTSRWPRSSPCASRCASSSCARPSAC